MNRPIKFRAWDRKNKCWIRLGNLYIPESADDSFTIAQDKYDVVQFTGLLDKNGKEIYEGDIVKTSMGKTYAIRWGRTGWIGENLTTKMFMTTLFNKQVEIIGNIYENPELISS